MLTKNLNFSFSQWAFWALISCIAIGGALLNAWFGFPFPASFEGVFSTVGGIIPYSDAEAYWTSAHQFVETGILNSWTMRRPLTTLLLAFYLKITGFNFWYVLILQASFCILALTIYLKTIRDDLGTLSALISLVIIYYYAQVYVQTTLSETLGLTLGLFSFLLLWNGWIEKKRWVFNFGMATLAIALCARAGPNFIVLGLFLLVFLHPFTTSRSKDLALSFASFGFLFFITSKLSWLFGDPSVGGMSFSNFAPVLYGLVSGGKGWTHAYNDPLIKDLLTQKTEAQQSIILLNESWRIFKTNPFNFLLGMGRYLASFLLWFVFQLRFGTGFVKIGTTILSFFVLFFASYRIYTKRISNHRAFLFLIIIFFSIAASAMIIFNDGGIRTFAVAIPFLGALFSFAMSTDMPMKFHRKTRNKITIFAVSLILAASAMAKYIPNNMKIPNVSVADKETILTYNPNYQPHLFISSSSGFHFRSIKPAIFKENWNIYSRSDELVGKELAINANSFENNNLVVLWVYDYKSHSSKWILSESHILDVKAEWIEIHVNPIAQDFKKIYKANSYMELDQK